MPTSRTYLVEGMTCGSCAGKVSDKVAELVGVEDLDVDLATGGLTLHSQEPVDDETVRAAVEEAGYKVVS